MTSEEKLTQSVKSIFNKILQFFDLRHEQDIIIFSHIRWNDALDRPQHIVKRLAKKRKVLYVEEPISFYPSDSGNAKLFYPERNVTVLQPKISPKYIRQELPLLIAKQIRARKLREPILWFYSSGFSEIIPFLNHSLIVYDYMNIQSEQHFAQEQYLLSAADTIFTPKQMYFEVDKHQNDRQYWDIVVARMEKTVNAALTAKIKNTKYTRPLYYPLIPHLTASR